MIKYKEDMTTVVFDEIPDEITLAINITNCPGTCEGCHSPILRGDVGEELTPEVVDKLIEKKKGITCVCLMGEGKDPKALERIITHIKTTHPSLKIGLYSGREAVDEDFYWENLNYLKIGPYKPEFGPLDKETTNQRLYHGGPYYSWCCVVNGKPRYGWHDITNKFWK